MVSCRLLSAPPEEETRCDRSHPFHRRRHAAPLTQSMARGATDVPLIELTMGACFDAMATRQPDHEALVSVHQGQRYTYRALQTEARTGWPAPCWAWAWSRGDRVGIWSHNNAEWVLMQLATAKVGLVLVNINPAYRTSELEYALNKVACKAAGDHAALQDQRLPGHVARTGARAGRCASPVDLQAAAAAAPAHGGVDRRAGAGRRRARG